MDSSRFRGTTVALITPFLSNGNVDETAYKNLLDWQIEQGTDVILTCGTTGESATLSHEEHEKVIEITIQHVNGRVPVLCGTGSNSTSEAISLTQFAEKAGADGILSVGPYYNKPPQEGFYQHFKAIAESVSLPVIIYNVPGRTGSNIAAQTTLRLADIPNIIGIKEASGNLSQIMAIIKDRPKGFLVLSGDDSITLPILSFGGDGVISVVANEVPAMLHEMVHSTFAGNWDRARELHNKLLPLMEFNFVESNPIPVKTAVALMGKVEDHFRLPLVNMTEANKQKMKDILKELGLI
ncbi:4-hydroxy-tetrahydrodipicolinate synthase [candidate division KSB1 bacterium]|nr:4-hydroxy-tetrahydrodipicolinate synthase [candidate division KSB1 bacterium]